MFSLSSYSCMLLCPTKVQIRIVCAPKIVFISLPINSDMCFGCLKEPSQ